MWSSPHPAGRFFRLMLQHRRREFKFLILPVVKQII